MSVFSPPTVSSHDEPGVAEIAKAERLWIEQEHRSILEEVLQGVLTEQPTSVDAIYEKYSCKCTSRELKKKLDKPRVRYSVKQYLRDMEKEGELKRVMNVREYFYVVTERVGKDFINTSNTEIQASASSEAIAR